jgi:ABC-type lipopolysaccharide export system ATPase subunit
MNCLSLNCRGAGNKPTVREIVGLAKSTSAKIVFLSETRQTSVKMRRLRARLGLRGFAGIDSNGLSGGLALY